MQPAASSLTASAGALSSYTLWPNVRYLQRSVKCISRNHQPVALMMELCAAVMPSLSTSLPLIRAQLRSTCVLPHRNGNK